MWIIYALYFTVAVLTLFIPVGIVIFLIRLFTKNKNSKPGESKPRDMVRDIFLLSIIMSAGISGIAGIFIIPTTFFNVTDITQSGTAMSIYLIFSMILLIAGVYMKELTGKFLMILGVVILIFSVLPFIDQFKSIGGFIVALIVFGLLVWLVVRSNRKASHG